ncbi:MAG: ABC transporter permease subunit [Candidatus Enteromonas sp.]|nr:ABC transporter permease subunit [Candidatus Enteromonas sp.]
MKFFARHERTIFTLFGLAFLILIWWIIAVLLQQNGTTLFLTPGETVSRILQLCFGKEAGSTFSAIGWTLFRLVLGFVFSFFLAGILGTLAGLFPKLRHFLKPFVGLSRSIPTAAVVLVFMGLLIHPRLLPVLDYVACFLTTMIAFPILYEAFAKGIEEEEEDVNMSLELECGKRSFAAVVYVLWPDSLPYISLGLVQALGLSLKVTIMSEVLTANNASHRGIGTLIFRSQTDPLFRTEDILPYSIIALLLMMILDIPNWILRNRINRKQNGNSNIQS